MPEDSGAQIVHDSLSYLIGQQGLAHTENAGCDCDRDHPAGIERERGRVVATDCLEHALEQEGRYHSQPG